MLKTRVTIAALATAVIGATVLACTTTVTTPSDGTPGIIVTTPISSGVVDTAGYAASIGPVTVGIDTRGAWLDIAH